MTEFDDDDRTQPREEPRAALGEYDAATGKYTITTCNGSVRRLHGELAVALGVADDELLMACPPDEFLRAIEGMGHLGKNGLRYPFPPYGAAMDPAFGMAKSYG